MNDPSGTSRGAGPGWWRRLGLRFGKFAAGSALSTVLSQGTLTLVYLLGASATTAAVLAFVAGAVPNFVINWRWTWGRRERPALLRELVPYLAIVIGGGLAATGLTTLADHLIAPLVDGRGIRTVALNAAYLGSYALFVVLKFALLDRLLAREPRPVVNRERGGATRTPASTSTS